MKQRELTTLLRAHTPPRAPAIELPDFPAPVPVAGPSPAPWLALAACWLVIAITAVHGHRQDLRITSGNPPAPSAPVDIEFLIATHLVQTNEL